MNQIDKKSEEFIKWARKHYFKNKDGWSSNLDDVMVHVQNLFMEKELNQICLDRMMSGAIEHGPTILENPLLVEKEKIEELADLINYFIMGKYQALKK